MKLWKRNAVVAAVVLFVCMAVYLNWSYDQQPVEELDAGKILGQAALVAGQQSDPVLSADGGRTGDGSTAGSGYFDQARLNRQQARDSALSLLQQAAREEGSDQAVRDQANESIQSMAGVTLSEAQIENLVTAKGYRDCVAFISDGSISVVVGAVEGGLTTADTARITDIVTGETGFTAGQIKIIEAQG